VGQSAKDATAIEHLKNPVHVFHALLPLVGSQFLPFLETQGPDVQVFRLDVLLAFLHHVCTFLSLWAQLRAARPETDQGMAKPPFFLQNDLKALESNYWKSNGQA
jgi:hypothetical protein